MAVSVPWLNADSQPVDESGAEVVATDRKVALGTHSGNDLLFRRQWLVQCYSARCSDRCVDAKLPALLNLKKSSQHRANMPICSDGSEVQLERFSTAYVWCRDIAAQLGKSPKATATLLREMGVGEASGPQVDRSRQLLFRRCDVVRVIPCLTHCE